jgi:hypothetical protein
MATEREIDVVCSGDLSRYYDDLWLLLRYAVSAAARGEAAGKK